MSERREHAAELLNRLSKLNKNEQVKILCSGSVDSLIISAGVSMRLLSKQISFSINSVPLITKELIENASKKDDSLFLCIDSPSEKFTALQESLQKETTFFFDHQGSLDAIRAIAENSTPHDALLQKVHFLLLPADEQSEEIQSFRKMLSACCKMSLFSIGFGALMGDPHMMQSLQRSYAEYSSKAERAVAWLEDNMHTKLTVHSEQYIIVNTKDKIPTYTTPALGSYLSKRKNKHVLMLTRSTPQICSISLHVHDKEEQEINELMARMMQTYESAKHSKKNEQGLHWIPTSNEESFIDHAKHILEKMSVEDHVD